MNAETLKRLEELYDKWANEAGTGYIYAEEVMDHLPDLIACVKERDTLFRQRDELIDQRDAAVKERDAEQKSCADLQLTVDGLNVGYIHEREVEPLVEALRWCAEHSGGYEAETCRQALAHWEKVKEAK